MSITEVSAESTYSPIAPHVVEDPATAYAELRSQCPVHLGDVGGNDLYSLALREDIGAALRDHNLWSNADGPGVGYGSGAGLGDMQHDDRPEHERRRGLARAWFVPPAIAEMEPELRELAESIAIDLAPNGGANLYSEFALPMPVTSFCSIMGISIDDREQFLSWADTIVIAMAYPERGVEARRALSAFTRAEVVRRRELADDGAELPAGLLSHLATAPYHDDGSRMAVDEVVGMSNQLLIAGHETSTSLITNCVWRLLEDRQNRWERVVADPSLIPNAIEESLRFDPPVLGLCRTNKVETEVRGVTIPERSKVMMLYASANRDPSVFERPDEFLVDRPVFDSMKHFSFSWGIHYCLGAHLARLTGRVALETLVRHFPSLHLSGTTERVASPFLWGRKKLPVAW
jgi:cytochrome P450